MPGWFGGLPLFYIPGRYLLLVGRERKHLLRENLVEPQPCKKRFLARYRASLLGSPSPLTTEMPISLESVDSSRHDWTPHELFHLLLHRFLPVIVCDRTLPLTEPYGRLAAAGRFLELRAIQLLVRWENTFLKKAHSASSCLRRDVEDRSRPYHSSEI